MHRVLVLWFCLLVFSGSFSSALANSFSLTANYVSNTEPHKNWKLAISGDKGLFSQTNLEGSPASNKTMLPIAPTQLQDIKNYFKLRFIERYKKYCRPTEGKTILCRYSSDVKVGNTRTLDILYSDTPYKIYIEEIFPKKLCEKIIAFGDDREHILCRAKYEDISYFRHTVDLWKKVRSLISIPDIDDHRKTDEKRINEYAHDTPDA